MAHMRMGRYGIANAQQPSGGMRGMNMEGM
jgi:hypothetical protein